MFDFTKILAVVEATAKAFVPGISESIAAAEAVVDLAKSIKPTLNSTDQTTLDTALGPLLAKMNADVDQAEKDLRGD